jgi:hypothetical protein
LAEKKQRADGLEESLQENRRELEQMREATESQLRQIAMQAER